MKFSWIDRFRKEPPSQFVYKELGEDQIRLLYLVPNPHKPDQLHVRLIHTKFDPPPKYHALSYVWGKSTEAPLPEILCSYNNLTTAASMPITPNLHAALAAIRPSKEFPMWADAICINQADNAREKQGQVRMMYKIYRSAEEVVVWFHPHVRWQEESMMRPPGRKIRSGPIHDGTEVAIELCRWLMAYMEDENVNFDGFPKLLRRFDTSGIDPLGRPSFTPEQARSLGHLLKRKHRLYGPHSPKKMADAGLPSYCDRIWTFLDQLFSHAWSTRTWTVQEVMLAKKATVRSGDCSVSWANFLTVYSCLSFSLGYELPGVEIQAEIDGRAYTREKLLSIFFVPFAEQKDHDLWFISLLSYLRVRDVTEPVDRVYGILALASQKLRAKIPVDYSETARKQYWVLYVRVTQIAMASGHAFHVLREVGPGDRLPDLPSWCPNYNIGGPLNGATWPIGRAGFFDDATAQILEPSLDPALIHFGGFSVDTVKLVLDDFTCDSCSINESLQGLEDITVRNLCWLWRIEQIIKESVLDSRIVPTVIWQFMLGYIPPSSDGTVMMDSAFSGEDFALFMLYLNELYALPAGSKRRMVFDKGQLDLFDAIWNLTTRLFASRRFFLTEKGRYGLGNIGTQAGDNVCVFLGEKVLYLLTPPETKTVHGKLDSYREFRSVAYVHGMMMGEALQDVKEGEHEIFNII